MDKETIQKGFYMALCNNEEIRRIFALNSTSDYLLKQRADATLDSTRIHRVFLRRRKAAGDKWNFSESFDVEPFENFKSYLDWSDKEEADRITAGFVFCDDPNGRIRKTEFGNLIMVSESLRYFLYFMNLSYLIFDSCEVPDDVRDAAMMIAIRTMLQSEALDFDLDPRGEIPEEVNQEILFHTNRQLEFVIGHEYAHGLLGHLESSNVIEAPMLSTLGELPSNKVKIYSCSQKNEFAADIDAIDRPIYTPDTRIAYLTSAIFFFAYLDIYESVREQITPSSGRPKTHPSPIERLWNLYERFKGSVEIDEENLKTLLYRNERLKVALVEDVATNIESYEFYGSIYLGSWRGRPLVDRVDF